MNLKKVILQPLLIIIIFFTTNALYAESIFMNDGSIIDGTIIKESNTRVKIKTDDRKKKYISRKKIIRIVYSDDYEKKVYLYKKDGSSLHCHIVEESSENYIIRYMLTSPEEYKISKDEVDAISKREIASIEKDEFADIREPGTQFDYWYMTIAYGAAVNRDFKGTIQLNFSNSYNDFIHYGFSNSFTFWDYSRRVYYSGLFTIGANLMFYDRTGIEIYLGAGALYAKDGGVDEYGVPVYDSNFNFVYKLGFLVPYRIGKDCIVAFCELFAHWDEEYQAPFPAGLIQVGVGYSL